MATLTNSELTAILISIKKDIEPEFINEPGESPSIQVTLAADRSELLNDKKDAARRYVNDWTVQTGDNSFTGSAYFFDTWAVTRLYRRSNTRDLARDLIRELRDFAAQV